MPVSKDLLPIAVMACGRRYPVLIAQDLKTVYVAGQNRYAQCGSTSNHHALGMWRKFQLPHVKFILPHAPEQPVTLSGGFRMPSHQQAQALAGEEELTEPQGAPPLVAGKVENASIRVENIIREDLNVEALKMLELCCELLIACTDLVEQFRVPAKPSGARYAAWHADGQVRQGTGAHKVMDNAAGLANDKLVRKLSADTSPSNLIKMYLTEIASFYHVKRRPDDEDADDDDDTPGG
ncbi:Vacuolar protein sorting-associated protein ist1 [Coemansia furcata]|nr:Vacuolar protein sorting-associated protein ist1 [Coemansia furcata]